MMKLFFELGADCWHGFATESVWAEETSDGICRLSNSPFFACDVSYGDVVSYAHREDGKDYFVKPVIRGGHSTYRIIPRKEASKDEFASAWQPLERLGCSFEEGRSPFTIYAVDVPPEVDIFEAYRLLEDGEEKGIWSFDEGHCGHAV